MLFKFYVNDALLGFLGRPILKNKFIRTSLALIGIGFYFWYFYINMRSFFRLGHIENLPKLTTLTKITIASYLDMFIILGIYMGVFINSTLNFSNTILFITNLLPFTKREITIGQKLFKLSFALIVFELLLMIVFPFFIRIAVMPLLALLVLFIVLHQVFIASFLIVDILYSTVLNFILGRSKNLKNIFQYVFDIFLVSIATVYMLVYRFPIENIMGHTAISIDSMLYLTYIFTLLLLLLIVISILKGNFYTPMQVRRKFLLYKIPLPKKSILYSLFALVRQKNFLYTLVTLILMVTVMSIQNNIKDALKVFGTFYFLIDLSGINYASATSNFRKLYDFYGISIIYEGISLVISSFVLSLPLLILTICLNISWDNVLISYALFQISIIFGFLFPKSSGSLNEMVALSLSIICGLIIYQLLIYRTLFFPIIIVLLCILLAILQKERSWNE